MKIDKSIGNWNDDASYLEDIVYMLYLEEYIIIDQNLYLSQGYVNYLLINREKYYEKANIIIRKEKLEKLNNL